MAQGSSIAEFFVEGSQRESSHALLHISEPDAHQKEKGAFFAVCEVEHGDTEQIGHLQTLIDDLESGTYESDFETALEFVNRRTDTVLGGPRSRVHGIIGVMKQEKLIFSVIGEAAALLFFREGETVSGMQITDQHEPSQDQLFSAVTEGTIHPGDIILFVTPGVVEHFSVDRLSKLLRDRSLDETLRHLERSLRELQSHRSFAGLFLDGDKKKHFRTEETQEAQIPQGSIASMTALLSKEKHTAATLSPPLLSSMSQTVKAAFRAEPKASGRSETEKRGSSAARRQYEERLLLFIARSCVVGIRTLILLLASFFLTIGRSIRSLFFVLTNMGGQRTVIFESWQSLYRQKRRVLSDLPILSKLFFFLTIIFAVVFLGSLAYMKFASYRSAQHAAYTAELLTIEAQIEQAQSRLIYDNKDEARTILQQAKTAATAFAEKSNRAKKDTEPLISQMNQMLEELRNVTLVNTSVLLDVSDQHPDFKPTELTLIGRSLLLFSQDDSRHLLYDLDTKEATILEHDTTRGLLDAATPKAQDTLFFSTKAAGVAKYNPELKAITQKDISFPESDVEIADIFLYNQKLYALTTNGQIYRHNPTPSGFDRGTAWIKSGQPIATDGRAIAIDGEIYVLTAHTILYFSQGEKQEYSLTGVDPALQDPKDIWTYADIPQIYILEGNQKRLMVIDKETGRMLYQLTNDSWTSPSSFVIDSTKNIAYILDGTTVRQIALP